MADPTHGDPYVYPGTALLRNKEDIRDVAEFRRYEAEITANRMEHLPRDISLTYDGYRAIHRHIFAPLFDWAGEIRTVNIAKGAMFCLAPYIDDQMQRRFGTLQAQGELKGLGADEFATLAAEHLGEINAIHPFREGNGRTQRAFLDLLAEGAGHPIDLGRLDAAAWMDASVRSFQDGDYAPMRAVIAAAMIGDGQEAAPVHDRGITGAAEIEALADAAAAAQAYDAEPEPGHDDEQDHEQEP